MSSFKTPARNSADSMTTNNTIPSTSSPLGVFEYFSPEIRSLLWQALIPNHNCNSDPAEYRPIPPGQIGGLLTLSRVNSYLYQETMAEFKRMKTLCFVIHPANRGWTVQGMEGAEAMLPHLVNFARLKKIKVNIYSPDRTDPGQLLRIRQQLMNLICMLARLQCALRNDGVGADKLQAPQVLLGAQGKEGWPTPPAGHRLPVMEINFVNQTDTVWQWGGMREPRVSIDAYKAPDIMYLLASFVYLRVIPFASMNLPPGLEPSEKVVYFMGLATSGMTRTDPFGTSACDEGLRFDESRRTVEFDLELDNMRGPTAAILRRERFQAWRAYESTILALIRVEEEDDMCPREVIRKQLQLLEGRRRRWMSWLNGGKHTIPVARFFGDGVGKYMYS